MFIDAISAPGGGAFASTDRLSAVTPISAATRSSSNAPGTAGPAQLSATSQQPPESPLVKATEELREPVMLVPTTPLSPAVLAALIGLDLSFLGARPIAA